MPKQITMVRWSAQNIPYGVAFDENTGIFSGSPANAGDYVIPVTVETNYGKDTKDVAIGVEDLKKVWVQTPMSSVIGANKYIRWAFDTEQGILFLYNSAYIFYNPATKTFSEIENLSFQPWAADIDPISKKWVCFASGKNIATSSGIKDLGLQIAAVSVHCSWSPVLQRFCIVKSRVYKTGGGTQGNGSFLVDVDGNLLGAVLENNIDNFAGGYLPESKNGGTIYVGHANEGQPLCWASGNINKFVLATSGLSNETIALSSDGLNWETKILDASVKGRIYLMTWLPEQNMLLAVKLNSSTMENHVYTSTDGENWTNIAILKSQNYNGGTGSNLDDQPYLHTGAWSPTKKVFCLCGRVSSFITKDFQNWEELPYPTGSNSSTLSVVLDGHVMWSNIANAFILTTYSNGFYTLHV